MAITSFETYSTEEVMAYSLLETTHRLTKQNSEILELFPGAVQAFYLAQAESLRITLTIIVLPSPYRRLLGNLRRPRLSVCAQILTSHTFGS